MAPLNLRGPYTQRICVDVYWPVNTLETERINLTATLEFVFYMYRKQQSVIFALYPTPKAQKQPRKIKRPNKNRGSSASKAVEGFFVDQ